MRFENPNTVVDADYVKVIIDGKPARPMAMDDMVFISHNTAHKVLKAPATGHCIVKHYVMSADTYTLPA